MVEDPKPDPIPFNLRNPGTESDKLESRILNVNVYQAATLNKTLAQFGIWIEAYDLVKKRTGKLKPKPKTPKPFSNNAYDDSVEPSELSLNRRQSTRERKPIAKTDLGYEEPKDKSKTLKSKCEGLIK